MSAKSWFNISAKAEDKPIDLMILGEIGGWGISARSLIGQLSQYPAARKVRMVVHSPGGSVFEGFAIYNYLKGRGNVDTIIIGHAASMASVVALAGDTVTIAKNAFFMVHNVSGGVQGNEAELRNYADIMAMLTAQLEETYVEETGSKLAAVRGWLTKDTWFNAEDAVRAGLADVVGEAVSFSAHADLSKFSNVPAALLASVDSAPGGEMKPEEISAAVEKNNDSIVSRIIASLNGDKELKASVERLTADITARDTEITNLKAQLAASVTAHTTALDALKASHATELTAKDAAIVAAKQSATALLARAGITSVPTEAKETGTGDAKTKREQYNALIASGDTKAAGEFYAANRDEIFSGK